MSIPRRSACVSSLVWVAAVALWLSAPAEAQQYKKTDLVSDLAGATFQDANLVNPWGLSRSSGSPWWAADNGTGLSTLYDGTGKAQTLVVTIPPAAGGTTGVPTGTVFNGTTDFKLPNGNPARFLFVTEDGTISGWNGGTLATVMSTDPDAVYKGAAIATRDGAHYLSSRISARSVSTSSTRASTGSGRDTGSTICPGVPSRNGTETHLGTRLETSGFPGGSLPSTPGRAARHLRDVDVGVCGPARKRSVAARGPGEAGTGGSRPPVLSRSRRGPGERTLSPACTRSGGCTGFSG